MTDEAARLPVHPPRSDRPGVSTKPPLNLPLNCSRCGQPVTLSFIATKRYQTASWTCPYGNCLAAHRFELKGKNVKVVARHVSTSAPERRHSN